MKSPSGRRYHSKCASIIQGPQKPKPRHIHMLTLTLMRSQRLNPYPWQRAPVTAGRILQSALNFTTTNWCWEFQSSSPHPAAPAPQKHLISESGQALMGNRVSALSVCRRWLHISQPRRDPPTALWPAAKPQGEGLIRLGARGLCLTRS